MDHAATTPLKQEVLQAMLPYFEEQYANASSGYASARKARQAIDSARAKLAALIHAESRDIYITSGGSEADNWALLGVMQASAPQKNHIITSAIEHAAVLRTCEALERFGAEVTYLPVDENGVVDPDMLEHAITDRTALISVMLANNETGTIQPIKRIAEIAHQHHILMHTDAVQAVGHITTDVQALGVDLLSLSAHKFYGPKGIGALYIRRGTKIGRFILGGEQEMGMRAGTENTAAIVGMGKAAELAGAEMLSAASRLTMMRDEMIEMLKSKIPGIRINGEAAERLPGHVHISIDEVDSSIVMMQMDMLGIAASSGSACAAGAHQRSHVMTAMGITGEHQADIRFSLGEQNTHEEICQAVEALASILR